MTGSRSTSSKPTSMAWSMSHQPLTDQSKNAADELHKVLKKIGGLEVPGLQPAALFLHSPVLPVWSRWFDTRVPGHGIPYSIQPSPKP